MSALQKCTVEIATRMVSVFGQAHGLISAVLGSVVYGTMESRPRSININFGVEFVIAM